MAIDFTKIELDSFYTLYKVSYLSENWYYTDADHQITYGGNTYFPTTIKHGDIIKDSELNKTQLEITAPITDFVKRFVLFAPPAKTIITLYLYAQTTPPEVFVAFIGELTKISFGQGNTCIIFLDEYTVLNLKLPKILIQPSCNHILFSSGCGLTKAAWKVTATVDSFEGHENYIGSNDFIAYPTQYFRQGVMEFGGDVRYISDHTGYQIVIQSAFYGLDVGDTVDVYPGCDKQPATCKNTFSNLSRYLGCPYVPRKNPVLYGI